MSYIAAGIALAGLTYNIYDSESKKSEAKKGLEELQKQKYPSFLTGEQIYTKAKGLATGLSPAESANIDDDLQRQATARYRYATDKNPTLSGAIQAATNFGGVKGILGKAALNEQVKRSSLNQLIGLIGGQGNLQTQSELQKRIGEETAYGTAYQQQNQNTNQSINQLGNMAFISYLNGGIGNKTTGNTTGSSVYTAPEMNKAGFPIATENPNSASVMFNEDVPNYNQGINDAFYRAQYERFGKQYGMSFEQFKKLNGYN